MSDDQDAPFLIGVYEHLCEHPGCNEWGGLGYSVGKQAPHWFCREHKDDGERLIGRLLRRH